jgi:hypothetical protein
MSRSKDAQRHAPKAVTLTPKAEPATRQRLECFPLTLLGHPPGPLEIKDFSDLAGRGTPADSFSGNPGHTPMIREHNVVKKRSVVKELSA